MSSTFATARSDLAAALEAAVGSTWAVYDHPTDALTDLSLAVSMRGSEKIGPGTWRRELVVGVFVRRDAIAAGFDELDSVVPAIAALELDGFTCREHTEPRPVSLAESEYIAVFMPATLETID